MNSSLRPDAAPPCDGDTRFESENPEIHNDLKTICNGCPVRDACQRLLEQTIRDYGYGQHVGPRGTWAGKLYTEPRRDRRSTDLETEAVA